MIRDIVPLSRRHLPARVTIPRHPGAKIDQRPTRSSTLTGSKCMFCLAVAGEVGSQAPDIAAFMCFSSSSDWRPRRIRSITYEVEVEGAAGWRDHDGVDGRPTQVARPQGLPRRRGGGPSASPAAAGWVTDRTAYRAVRKREHSMVADGTLRRPRHRQQQHRRLLRPRPGHDSRTHRRKRSSELEPRHCLPDREPQRHHRGHEPRRRPPAREPQHHHKRHEQRRRRLGRGLRHPHPRATRTLPASMPPPTRAPRRR